MPHKNNISATCSLILVIEKSMQTCDQGTALIKQFISRLKFIKNIKIDGECAYDRNTILQINYIDDLINHNNNITLPKIPGTLYCIDITNVDFDTYKENYDELLLNNNLPLTNNGDVDDSIIGTFDMQYGYLVISSCSYNVMGCFSLSDEEHDLIINDADELKKKISNVMGINEYYICLTNINVN